MIEGQLFSRFLPEGLRGPLPMPPRGASIEERREYEQAFNLRARYRYIRHAGPDADGTTRWMCPFHAELLPARELPWTMRKSKRAPLVRLPEGTTKSCSGTVTVAAAELPRWQPYPPGTTAWRVSMGRRQLVETANSLLKTHFVNLSRGFFRVFGRTKLTFLLSFTIAACNLQVARSFLARQAQGGGADKPVRRRAKRRKGT